LFNGFAATSLEMLRPPEPDAFPLWEICGDIWVMDEFNE
jgi:hypothetical protein